MAGEYNHRPGVAPAVFPELAGKQMAFLFGAVGTDGLEVGLLEGVVGVNQFAKELEHFVDAIENGTPLWVTPEDNYLVQKLIEDCRAAAASKPLPSAKVA